MIKLTDDIYRKFMIGKKYLDDQTKVDIFNFLKKENE